MIIGSDYVFAGHARWNMGWPTPNYAAAFLAPVLPWCWCALLFARSATDRAKRISWFPIMALEGLLWFALLKTYSRGGLVAVLLAGGYFLVQVHKRLPRHKLFPSVAFRIVFILAIMAATGFYARLAPDYISDDGAVVKRLDLWRGALKMIAASPVRGWGSGESGMIYMNWFQSIGSEDRYTTMVNSYLHVATEYGLPLFALIMAGIWIIALDAGRHFAKPDEGISRYGLAACGARASVIAWAAANIFTTLWIDVRLWIIPSISALVALLSLCYIVPNKAIERHIAFALGFGIVAAIGLYGIGLGLSSGDMLAVVPGSEGSVLAIRRGIAASPPTQDTWKQDWHIWPDRAVLGPIPGQELRTWLQALAPGNRLIVHPASSRIAQAIHGVLKSRSGVPAASGCGGGTASTLKPSETCDAVFSQAHGILLFGRQVERWKELLDSGLTADEVWLIHPFSHAPVPIPAEYGSARVTIILSEIDQSGQNGHWRAWGGLSHATVLISPGAGTDIRVAWPDILGQKSQAVFYGDAVLPVEDVGTPAISATAAPLPTQPSPLWLGFQARLHAIALDGTWRQSYLLGTNRTLQLLNFGCRLDHHVEINAYGSARTLWTIPALRTWLAPEGRQKLAFQPPDGPQVRFQRSAIGEVFGKAELSSWEIRKTGPDTFELLGSDRSLWVYTHGVLTSIEDPLLGRFAVRTQGGLIRDIRNLDFANAVPLLAADYDEEGNPIRFALRNHVPNTFVWSNGQLAAWKRAGRANVVLSYADGLISEIDEPGRPARHIGWAENPGFMRGDSRWYEPVCLRSDDFFDYKYDLTDEGYLIRVTNRAGDKTETTLFNPLRRQLVQRDSTGKTVIVTFRRNQTGAIPEKIEDGNGHLLEP